MKIHTSLLTKILAWFFLGLIVMTLVVALFVQKELKGTSILNLGAKDRVVALAKLFHHELVNNEQGDWDSILERFDSAYEVSFCLADHKGRIVAGDLKDLDPFIVSKINIQNAIYPVLAMHPPPMHPGNPGEKPHMGFPEPRHQPDDEKLHPVFFARTKSPSRFWAGVTIPIPKTPGMSPDRYYLLAYSESRGGNGLFFDPRPWFLLLGILLAISVIWWIPMIRSITRPLREVTKATQQIAQGKFGVKLKENRNDEIGALSTSINEMSKRLEGFVKGQKRFLGDIAHELASPIAKIRLGLGILENKLGKDGVEKLSDVAEEAQHMSGLVNELLSFSRAEINPGKVRLKKTALAPVVERVITREAPDNVRVITSIGDRTDVIADQELLARALANLLRNAVRYAGNAGPIEIAAKREGDKVNLEVKDKGPGVPEEVIGQLFEPFYRPDPSRERQTGGVGLGMAIVKTCVQTCNGTASARNRKPSGFAVSILLEAG